MPVTKTAKRALKSSRRKKEMNKVISSRLEVAVRRAKKAKKEGEVRQAMSLADRAAKKKLIHKNKAARIKSALSKLLGKVTKKTSKVASKKSVKTKPSKKK